MTAFEIAVPLITLGITSAGYLWLRAEGRKLDANRDQRKRTAAEGAVMRKPADDLAKAWVTRIGGAGAAVKQQGRPTQRAEQSAPRINA